MVHADWITNLPVSEEGYDQILVVVDRVTKFAYLIPAKETDTAEDTAGRLFQVVFCVHGPPKMLVSDRDRRFTEKVFQKLMQLIGCKQKMDLAYTHNYNGSVEALNKTIEVMLRHVLSGTENVDFTMALPFCQYVYNTSKHSATKMTPYRALFGREAQDPVNWFTQAGMEIHPNVHENIKHMARVLARVRDSLHMAQQVMERYENRAQRDVSFDIGDMVYLDARNLGSSHFVHSARKLRERYIGPFKILRRVARYAYELDVKDTLPRVHPVFHVALLWKFIPREEDVATGGEGNEDAVEEHVEGSMIAPQPQLRVDDPLQDVDGAELFEVEAVLAKKGNKYLVKWLTFDDEAANSWITAGMFRGDEAKALRNKFDEDLVADQQRKKAQRQNSEEQARIAGSQSQRKSDRRPVPKKSRD